MRLSLFYPSFYVKSHIARIPHPLPHHDPARPQQLHRKLSDLQKTRTELRWLLEQVERLEYEAL